MSNMLHPPAIEAGDIVFAPVAAGSEIKSRYLVVIYAVHEMRNLLCMYITSEVHQELKGVDFLLREGGPDFRRSGLKHTSLIQVTKVTTINLRDAQRKGSVSPSVLSTLRKRYKDYLEFLEK